MTCIRIDEEAFFPLQQHVKGATQHFEKAIERLQGMQYVTSSLDGNVPTTIAQLHQDCTSLQSTLQQLHSFVQDSLTQYKGVEETQRMQVGQLEKLPRKFLIPLQMGLTGGLRASQQARYQTYTWRSQSSFSHPFQQNGMSNLFRNGLHAQVSYQLDMVGASMNHNISNMQLTGSAALGHAEIKGKAHFVLKEKDVFDPSLNLEVGAKASLAHGLLSLNWKNQILGVSASATGELGSVEASGVAKISKKGIHIEGEVGAAAAKGKVIGSFEIFGIKFTASAHGEVGAVGVGGTFKVEDKSFEIGAKASCLLGGGVDFKVDW